MEAVSNKLLNDLLCYAVLLCGRNEMQTAGYYASAAFELLLPNLPEATKEKCYEKRITAYCLANQCSQEIYNTLMECRWVRNQLIHYNDTRQVSGFIDDICTVRSLNRHQLSVELDGEDLRRLRKKFSSSVPSSNCSALGKLFVGFSEQDFRNLHEMRNTLNYLKEKLTSHCNGLKPALFFDEISETTSAYVWLAAVKSLDGERPKIDQPSLSILATNHDVRVYLDFGGRCKKERKRYYHLLLNKKLDPLLKSLGSDFRIFDTYWYFNLENIRTLQEFYELREHGTLTNEEDLKRQVAEFEFLLDEKRTVPENKLLIGRIFPKEEVIPAGSGFAKEVCLTISKLHPIFEKL